MKNPNGLLSLVEHVGEESIKIQVVHHSIDGSVKEKKGETTFTMVTDSKNLSPRDFLPGNQPKMIGLVLWMEAEQFDNWKKSKK